MSLPRAAVLLFGFLSVASCTSGGELVGTQRTAALLGGEWALVSETSLPEGAERPTLNVATDGRVSGSAGVNRFHGTVDPDALAEGRWLPGPMAATRRAGPPLAMALESVVLTGMGEADRLRIEDGTLELRQGDRTLLRFVRL